MAVHLGLEFCIGLGLGIGPLQIEDQRHQRLGDKAAAVNAEMAALIGTAAIGVQLSRFGAGTHEALARTRGAAAFAAWMKRLTKARSFSPGPRSTPDETSTRAAPVSKMASPTVSGVSPPDKAKGAFAVVSARQSKTTPLPPGSMVPAGAFESNRT